MGALAERAHGSVGERQEHRVGREVTPDAAVHVLHPSFRHGACGSQNQVLVPMPSSSSRQETNSRPRSKVRLRRAGWGRGDGAMSRLMSGLSAGRCCAEGPWNGSCAPLDLSFLRVDETMDRLMAEPVPSASIQPKTACDLLPAVYEPLDDRSPQLGSAHELAAGSASPVSRRPRRHRPVALGLRDLGVVPPVALQLAVDRRTVATKRRRGLGDRNSALAEPRRLAALLEAQVGERAGHGVLQRTLEPVPRRSSK